MTCNESKEEEGSTLMGALLLLPRSAGSLPSLSVVTCLSLTTFFARNASKGQRTFFFTLVTGHRRSLSLKLSDTNVFRALLDMETVC